MIYKIVIYKIFNYQFSNIENLVIVKLKIH